MLTFSNASVESTDSLLDDDILFLQTSFFRTFLCPAKKVSLKSPISDFGSFYLSKNKIHPLVITHNTNNHKLCTSPRLLTGTIFVSNAQWNRGWVHNLLELYLFGNSTNKVKDTFYYLLKSPRLYY